MASIEYVDRKSGQVKQEKVYGKVFIELLYGQHLFSWLAALVVIPLCRISFFSHFYGWVQKSRFSKRKIAPFIRDFQIDAAEFLEPVSAFDSFNSFFVRKLRPSARPIASDSNTLICPADARYLVYADNRHLEGKVFIKGQELDLQRLIGDEKFAKRYQGGGLVIARLCPVDYHRFHFPCAGRASAAKLINGPLYSVNLIALKRSLSILTENKRKICQLDTAEFGKILYIEVGATHVGSIVETYTPDQRVEKGQEKGYFEFGGSCLILLFEPERVVFESDLLDATKRGYETLALLGQPLARGK